MKNALALCCVLLTIAPASFAWGPQGHMMVAAIAWRKLTPSVKQELTRLLKLNPEYDTWIEGVSDSDADEIAFITAATWPDFIKGADGYKNDGEHPSGPDAADNIGYDDKLQHRYWHFYDTPFSPDHTATHAPDDVSALTQIRMFTRALKNSNDDSVLSYDLVWLEHMVGDVHQPLHATSRFDEEDPQGDNGGNRIHLCSSNQAKSNPKTCKTSLHSFWDGLPGSGDSPTTARSRANGLMEANLTKSRDLDPSHWIAESFDLAESAVYTKPVDEGDGPFVLTAPYQAKAKTVASQQVALAGARLANLLNASVVTTH